METRPTPLEPAAGALALPQWWETLRDGRHVHIRPITAADHDADRVFIESLSPEARRFRFLGQLRCPSEPLLDRLTRIDQVHDVAFAAVATDAHGERIVGVARYSTDADGDECECAVTVRDDWQDAGLGSLLLRHLIDTARNRGVRRMISIDMAENSRMHRFAGYHGFSTRPDPDDGSQVIHELAL